MLAAGSSLSFQLMLQLVTPVPSTKPNWDAEAVVTGLKMVLMEKTSLYGAENRIGEQPVIEEICGRFVEVILLACGEAIGERQQC